MSENMKRRSFLKMLGVAIASPMAFVKAAPMGELGTWAGVRWISTEPVCDSSRAPFPGALGLWDAVKIEYVPPKGEAFEIYKNGEFEHG